jgi:hypothetical protein
VSAGRDRNGETSELRSGGTAAGAGFGLSPLEQSPLGVVMDERKRTTVGVEGVVEATQPTPRLGTPRVQVAMGLEIELIDDAKACSGTNCLGERNGPVQLRDRGSPLSSPARRRQVDDSLMNVRPPPRDRGSSACRY